MAIPRVIPTLLYSGEGLVKGKRFSDRRYVGDPINAIKIFNDKCVDELAIFDISATKEGRCISVSLVESFARECFMPLMVGGGIRTVDQARKLLAVGAEKVMLNSAIFENPERIRELVEIFGAQSVVACVDYRLKGVFKKKNVVFSSSGTKSHNIDPVSWAKELAGMGVGEILVSSIDREGSYQGFDLDVISEIASQVDIPVLASGGGKCINDAKEVIDRGASGACFGSSFVFHGAREAVLISYPDREEIDGVLGIAKG